MIDVSLEELRIGDRVLAFHTDYNGWTKRDYVITAIVSDLDGSSDYLSLRTEKTTYRGKRGWRYRIERKASTTKRSDLVRLLGVKP